MGEVIQMFKDPPEETPGGVFVPDEVLTESMQDSLAAAVSDIEGLFACHSVEDFRAQMLAVKERVAGWPDG